MGMFVGSGIIPLDEWLFIFSSPVGSENTSTFPSKIRTALHDVSAQGVDERMINVHYYCCCC